MADNNKNDSQTQASERTIAAAKTVPKPEMKSRSKYAKEGWGSWPSFMHSYQLKTWEPDDVEEGHRILDAFRQSDYENEMKAYREQVGKDGK